ncbi:MAG: helix-turn-helix domain-containing protein [Coleofasciculus sp. G3-WIS-01]|uniref:helix-turn-helix domain-containing protein n=1 Tax=Coleofasciculus sp. G3-WIS-01 TaxID=3069528 RepID=UPI0033042B33
MDLGSTARKSKKIRIYLSPEQRNLVNRWMGVSRFVFNKTVEYLQQPDTKANWKAIKGGILDSLPEWCKEVPYQIKSIAIKDACTAVREANKKYKRTGQRKKVKFRSRKNKIQSCYIPKSAVTDLGIYYTILGKIRYTEQLPDNIGDCRLVFHHSQHYICVPHDVPRQASENQGRVVALDPGVRSILTLFTEDSFGWIGTGDIGRIQRLCYYLDDLISRLALAKAKQRRRLRKAADRLRLRIRHLIDEMHHKVARFLVVLDCNEAYTSKTVSWTGEIIPNLGGKKVIVGGDGFRMDRDINGARGIFLRALGDIPSLRACLFECIVSKC